MTERTGVALKNEDTETIDDGKQEKEENKKIVDEDNALFCWLSGDFISTLMRAKHVSFYRKSHRKYNDFGCYHSSLYRTHLLTRTCAWDTRRHFNSCQMLAEKKKKKKTVDDEKEWRKMREKQRRVLFYIIK